MISFILELTKTRMDADSVCVEDGSQINDASENFSPCVLCDRTEAQASLKCCLKFLCFKCYNKMARSARTLACPHCRENPLQFFDEDDDSSIEESDEDLHNNEARLFENERTVHVIVDSENPGSTDALPREVIEFIRRIYAENYGNQVQNLFAPNRVIGLQNRINVPISSSEPPLINKIVFAVQGAFLLLQFIIYYFLPKWSVTAFFIGFVLGMFDISFITKIIIYPIIYPVYIFKTYVNKSIAWRYIKRLDLTENRI